MACNLMRGGRALLCALVVLVGAALPARAQERSLEFREMNAQIVVTREGAVTVTERLVVHFSGSWQGIYRTIPVKYRTSQGMNYTLRIQPVSVTDDSGNELRYEVDNVGDMRRFKMWVPGATDATHTVVLTYRVANGLRFFEEHDELYWNVTGDQWDYPIQQVTAEVLLPEDVTGIRTTGFTGAHGSTDAATVEELGSAVIFRSTQPTGYRDDLTIVVGWNPGVVARPTAVEKAGTLFVSNGVLLIPIIAFFAMLVAWRRFGRDPAADSVFVRYEPPKDMTPAEAGTLIDDRADPRDVTATLVDLAVRGFARIEEKDLERLFGLLSKRDYEIVLLEREKWAQLKPHENALLTSLSSHATNDRVLMSDLENKFYTHLSSIRDTLGQTLVSNGYYRRRPQAVRVAWLMVGAVATFAITMGGSVLNATIGVAIVAAWIAGIATGIIIAAFGWNMPRRTTEGARMHTWLRGFEEFLGRVEADRLERLIDSPAAFERFLPYAMAFGVEKNWARAFEGIASEPPRWYTSADGRAFRPNLFVADLGRMSTAATSSMSSSPRSSGSSGFSGGSSGGGFGGGGGGGF